VPKTNVFVTHEAEACVIEVEELPVVDIVRSSREVILRACLVRVRVGMVLYAISYEKDIYN